MLVLGEQAVVGLVNVGPGISAAGQDGGDGRELLGVGMASPCRRASPSSQASVASWSAHWLLLSLAKVLISGWPGDDVVEEHVHGGADEARIAVAAFQARILSAVSRVTSRKSCRPGGAACRRATLLRPVC